LDRVLKKIIVIIFGQLLQL